MSTTRSTRLALIAVLCACASLPLSAARAQERWLTVGDDALATLRGGFDLGSGVLVSFGLTREVYLNGTLAVSTSFQIADVARIAPSEAQQIQRELGGMQLIQNGSNSVFLPGGTTGSLIGTTVQNTLNDQRISTQTIIDASSNGTQMLRGLNHAGVLRDALVNSLGGR